MTRPHSALRLEDRCACTVIHARKSLNSTLQSTASAHARVLVTPAHTHSLAQHARKHLTCTQLTGSHAEVHASVSTARHSFHSTVPSAQAVTARAPGRRPRLSLGGARARQRAGRDLLSCGLAVARGASRRDARERLVNLGLLQHCWGWWGQWNVPAATVHTGERGEGGALCSLVYVMAWAYRSVAFLSSSRFFPFVSLSPFPLRSHSFSFAPVFSATQVQKLVTDVKAPGVTVARKSAV